MADQAPASTAQADQDPALTAEVDQVPTTKTDQAPASTIEAGQDPAPTADQDPAPPAEADQAPVPTTKTDPAPKIEADHPTASETNDLVSANEERRLMESIRLTRHPELKLYAQYESPSTIQGDRPGPIENQSLLDVEGEIKTFGVREDVDYHFLPKEAWDLLYEWYGGGPVIERPCVRSNSSVFIELTKQRLQVLWSRQPKNIVQKRFGKSTTIQQFLNEMHKTMKFKSKNVRVVDFYSGHCAGTITSERWTKTLEECHLLDNQHVIIEEMKKDGTWPLSSKYKHLKSSNQYEAPPSPPGQTGLKNLGNTCFMNSALQCLSAAAPLTDFMLRGDYIKDLNTTNPLGMGGAIANEYKKFVAELWSSRVGVHDPREMKNQIQKFAPQFSGYAQHDSQELLAFLLDGLHEDLNRIVKKPHVETLDTWTPEEAWEGHKKRNDSIIVDLFQGQLKSRLKCPNNGRVSVCYDPFMYLTVQLPVDKRKLPICVYRRDPSLKPIKLVVAVDKNGLMTEIKAEITKITGIPTNALALVDVFSHKLYREWLDSQSVSEIRETDDTAAYEIIPTVPKAPSGDLPDKPSDKPSKPSDEPSDEPSDKPSDETSDKPSDKPSDETSDKPSDEPSDELSDEPEIVRVLIHHERHRKNETSNVMLFGTPLILSVPENITYQQLYIEIVHHLSGGAPPDATSGGIFKRIPPLAVTTDPPPSDAPPPCPMTFVDNTVFELIPRYHKACANNGSSLHLVDRIEIKTSWPKKFYEYYIDEPKLGSVDFEIDESVPASMVHVAPQTKTLSECLELFNEEEQLAPSDTWYCSECKDHVQAFKKFSIWTAPKILVIHLKRFSYHGHVRERINLLVDFPLTDLDMAPYIEGPKLETKYDLFAISNHYGNLGGGHYTAFSKSRDGEWYRFDDTSVSHVSDPTSVISSAAYVLLYKRHDVDWPAFDPAFDKAKQTAPASSESEDHSDEYESEEHSGEPNAEYVVQDDIGRPPAPVTILSGPDDNTTQTTQDNAAPASTSASVIAEEVSEGSSSPAITAEPVRYDTVTPNSSIPDESGES